MWLKSELAFVAGGENFIEILKQFIIRRKMPDIDPRFKKRCNIGYFIFQKWWRHENWWNRFFL